MSISYLHVFNANIQRNVSAMLHYERVTGERMALLPVVGENKSHAGGSEVNVV